MLKERNLTGSLMFVLFVCVLVGGCSPTSSTSQSKLVPDNSNMMGPRIHSIGVKNVLPFEKGKKLLIPIEGRGLETAVEIGVDIQGIGRLIEGEKYDYLVNLYKKDVNEWEYVPPNLINIELQEVFTAKCETGDPLIVTVILHDPNAPHNKRIATGSRAFVLYDANDYRENFVKTRVGYHEFTAFPLPSSEARYIFGDVTDSLYYIVRLSMTNTSKFDRLVNTGMIKAYGRVIVNPPFKDETLYTIPVMISPQSREHVYAIITDTKLNLPREKFFGFLEFTGTLAASITTGFDFSEDVIRASSLFTGVGIPEGKKLLPDPVPSYLKNVVNFATPDLVEISRGGTSLPTYLFFSKKELQALIGDASMFDRRTYATTKHAKKKVREYEKPSVQVVYLAFDSLDIPFQVIVDPNQE